MLNEITAEPVMTKGWRCGLAKKRDQEVRKRSLCVSNGKNSVRARM